jgi:hypothetical protein
MCSGLLSHRNGVVLVRYKKQVERNKYLVICKAESSAQNMIRPQLSNVHRMWRRRILLFFGIDAPGNNASETSSKLKPDPKVAMENQQAILARLSFGSSEQ